MQTHWETVEMDGIRKKINKNHMNNGINSKVYALRMVHGNNELWAFFLLYIPSFFIHYFFVTERK